MRPSSLWASAGARWPTPSPRFLVGACPWTASSPEGTRWTSRRGTPPPILECFRQPHHPRPIRLRVPPPILRRQLSRQRRDYLLAVPGPFLPEDVLPDTGADVPVEANQGRVDSAGGLLAGGLDQGPEVGQKPVGGNRQHGRCGGTRRSALGDHPGLGHRQLSKNSGWSGFFVSAFRPLVDFFVDFPRPDSAAPLRRSSSARWRLSSRRRARTSSRKSSGQR